MPNILHVTPYMHSAAGGPPVVVDRWAEFASARGWPAVVLSVEAPARVEDANQPSSRKRRYDLRLLPSAFSPLLSFRYLRLVEQLVDRADIVHLHTMWSPLNAILARVCRRVGRPYVLSPHGMLDPYSLGVKPLRKRLYLRLLERALIDGAAGVLFTAAEERDLAVSTIGLVPEPQVVALGADLPGLAPELLAARFRALHPQLVDKKCIVFLGRLHAKKRPEVAVQSMPKILADVPDACLLLAGGGCPKYTASLQELARRFGVADRVFFLGMLGGEEKWGALACGEVFVLPSQQENFAIALAEALQVGVPVLTTRKVNIWREVVNAGAGLPLREEALVEDFVQYTVSLLTDSERRERMGDRARALALDRYTWPASTYALCTVYDTVIRGHQGPIAP